MQEAPGDDDDERAPDHPELSADDGATIEEDLPPQGLGTVETQSRRTLHEQRFTLAISLLGVVAGIAFVLLGASIWGPLDHLETVKSIAGTVFGPLVTLLGTSFAWYYASRKHD